MGPGQSLEHLDLPGVIGVVEDDPGDQVGERGASLASREPPPRSAPTAFAARRNSKYLIWAAQRLRNASSPELPFQRLFDR